MNATDTTINSSHILDLRNHLERQKIHPVLIFGSRSSGKTVLLLSLLARTGKKGIPVWEPHGLSFVPDDFPDASRRQNLAKTLIEKELEKFEQGFLPERTEVEVPFFITARMRKDGKVAHFGFIETKGEWFERQDESSYKPLREEIRVLLTHYHRPMSVIFVAPYEMDAGSITSLVSSHHSLRNAMDNYTRLRAHAGQDHLSYILSKWDVCLGTEHDSLSRLRDPDPKVVQAALACHPLINSWASFAPLDALSKAATKSMLPYSAGRFKDRCRLQETGDVVDLLDRYPKDLWDWLWCNATGQSVIPNPPSQVAGAIARCEPSAPAWKKAWEFSVKVAEKTAVNVVTSGLNKILPW